MRLFKKLFCLFFLLLVFVEPVLAATKASAKTYKTIDVTSWANKHGISYAKISGSNDIETIVSNGFSLGVGICGMLALLVIVYGGVSYVRSLNTQLPEPKKLIYSLLFAGLLINIPNTLGLVSNVNCSVNSSELGKCIAWDDKNSGLTGELKEKITKNAENKNGWDTFYAKFKKVISLIQLLSFFIFCHQLFTLWSICVSGTKSGGYAATIIRLICAALIVDLPHTVDWASNTIKIIMDGVK
jgi:hypothetical protein